MFITIMTSAVGLPLLDIGLTQVFMYLTIGNATVHPCIVRDTYTYTYITVSTALSLRYFYNIIFIKKTFMKNNKATLMLKYLVLPLSKGNWSELGQYVRYTYLSADRLMYRYTFKKRSQFGIRNKCSNYFIKVIFMALFASLNVRNLF